MLRMITIRITSVNKFLLSQSGSQPEYATDSPEVLAQPCAGTHTLPTKTISCVKAMESTDPLFVTLELDKGDIRALG